MSEESSKLNEIAHSLTKLVGLMEYQEESSRTGSGELDIVSKRTQSAMEEFSKRLGNLSGVSDDVKEQLKSVHNVNKLMSKTIKERSDIFDDLLRKRQANAITQDEFIAAQIRRLGRTYDASIDSLDKFSEAERPVREELIASTRGLSDSFDDVAKQNQNIIGRLKQSGLGVAATLLATEVYNTAKVITGTGIEFTTGQAVNAAMLGLSTGEMLAHTAKFTQTMRAATMGTSEFSNLMRSSAYDSLVRLTGGTKEAIEFYAEGALLARQSGAGTKDAMVAFQSSIESGYEEMQRMTGMTSDIFIGMNKALIANSDIQAQMFKMSKKQQLLFSKELIHRRNALTAMGLLPEQAQEVLSALAKSLGGTAKDRFTEAAELQAALGAMGLGNEGARAAEIIRMGARAGESEQKELTAILLKGNKLSAQATRGTYHAEFTQDALNTLSKYLGPDAVLSGAVTGSKLAQNPNFTATPSNASAVDGLDKISMEYRDKLDKITAGGFSKLIEDTNKLANRDNASTVVIGGDVIKGLASGPWPAAIGLLGGAISTGIMAAGGAVFGTAITESPLMNKLKSSLGSLVHLARAGVGLAASSLALAGKTAAGAAVFYAGWKVGGYINSNFIDPLLNSVTQNNKNFEQRLKDTYNNTKGTTDYVLNQQAVDLAKKLKDVGHSYAFSVDEFKSRSIDEKESLVAAIRQAINEAALEADKLRRSQLTALQDIATSSKEVIEATKIVGENTLGSWPG